MSRADEVWRSLVDAVWEAIVAWKQRVTEETGLPFGRIRALRRLSEPRSLRDLAEAMGLDAPATTVTIDDLEERGLAKRMPHPTNGRMKLVALTPAGKRMLARIEAVPDGPPPAFAALSAPDLAAVQRMIAALARS